MCLWLSYFVFYVASKPANLSSNFNWYTGKRSFFKLIFFICSFDLNINKQFLAFVTFILVIDLEFSFQYSKCKQKHDLSFVYIAKNWELCIWLITRRLPLKCFADFWSIVNNKNGKIIIDLNRGHAPLLYWS